MKICKECQKEYDSTFVSHSSKYCSENCRKIVRARVNLKQKMKRLEKLNNGDIEFIASETFNKYRQRAPSRGLEFTLTLDFFRKNVNANCYYCNEKLHKVGFDRLDNSIGYIESNSVPCCADCNFMKRNMSLELFLKKCNQISKNQKK